MFSPNSLFRFLPPFITLTGLLLAPAAVAQEIPAAQVEQGTVVRPGVLLFKVKPALKSRLREHQIEDAILAEALRAVGATELTQKFPRAVAAPERSPQPGTDLTLVYQVRYRASLPFEKVRHRLLATAEVSYVEPVYERTLLFQPNDPLADSVSGSQYHLKNIRAYHAWDVEQGDTSTVVGLIDTGTQFTHEDLQGQFAINYADPINGLDDDGDGYVDNYRGWDMADRDNDPSADAITTPQPGHGVLVSGTLAATTNNGKGVAGAGFKCRFLPVKIYASTLTGGFAGYEGIVYAADHGCQVINCSWGGPGAPSKFEQDVITYATVNRDAVVVAAAGNTNADLDFYPASYKGVLSVASLDRNDIKGASNTFAHRISLSAPGRQIMTTHYVGDTTYILASGSSFASPLVAAATALVRHHFPGLKAAQAAERVRVTADTTIYDLAGNANFREMLGRGRVNMYRAVADTAVRSVRIERVSYNRSRPYYSGDTLLITTELLNYLAPMRGLTVTISSPSANVQVLDGAFVVGPMSSLDSASNTAQPFRVVLLPSTPLNAIIPLRFGFRDVSGYQDFQYFKLEVNPDFVTLDINRVDATVTSRGNLGFDNGDLRRGDGVNFDGGDILLSEGGLLVGRSATRVSDMIRSAVPGQPDHDFQAVAPVRFQRQPTLPWADQAAEGIFEDTAGLEQANVRVLHRAWANGQPGRDRIVFLEYDVVQRATAPLTTGYVGLFADWDIYQFEHNRSDWNAARRLTYVYNVNHDSIYAGIMLLTGQTVGVYALDNSDPTTVPVSSADGLTTAEKYRALQAGVGTPSTAGSDSLGTDVAHIISARLPSLAPGDTARVAFAIVVGTDLTTLLAAADTAQAMYNAAQIAAPLAVGTGAGRCGAGALTLTATGAPNGGAYRWYTQPTGGSRIGGATTGSYTTPALTATTTYYVSTVTRAGREGTRVPVVATIEALPAAAVAASGSTALCAGDSLILTATGGNSYRWSTGDTTISIVVRTAGAYAVTATNAAGCIDTSAAVTVTVEPLPTAPALTAAPQGTGTVLLTAAAPGAVQFYLNGVPVAGAVGTTYLVTTGTQSGTYTATYTSPSGCVSVPSASVGVSVTGMIANHSAGGAFDLYPNPTSVTGSTTLTFYQPMPGGGSITIVDALGRQVLISGLPTGDHLTLPVLPAGVYAVQLHTATGTVVRRLVSQ